MYKVVVCGRQAEPAMHRFLPNRSGWRRKLAKEPTAIPQNSGVLSPSQKTLLPEIGQKWKADREPAVGYPRINLVLTFGPHLAFSQQMPKWNAVPVRRWHALQWQR